MDMNLLPLIVQAQDTIPAGSEQEIFIDRYNVPEFPGGQKALFEYLASNVRYEDLVWDADITGRVVVQFLVQADGSITDITRNLRNAQMGLETRPGEICSREIHRAR